MKLRTKISEYCSDKSGNIVVMTAVILPVLFLAIGASVSIVDGHSRRLKLQSHADIMSLQMAKKRAELESKDARLYFREYMATEMRVDEDCTFKM